MTPPGAGAAAIPAAARPRRLHAALVTMRPRQWIKNALVIAAAGAAGALGHDDVPVRVSLTCIAFCLLASGIYALNDIRDAAEDRLHPRKRLRPVAAGELEPRRAAALGLALIAAGLTVSALVGPLVAFVALGYVALTVSYTALWRRIPVLDVIAVAGGFVLRALAGGAAAPVALSRWFVLVVTFMAIFVAAGKRQAELRRTERDGVASRRVLGGYSERGLRLILAATAACGLFSYCVWAFELPIVAGIPWRPLTIIPFAVCLLRYGALVRAGDAEAPEDLLLGDRRLQLAAVAWLLLFTLTVHVSV